jgi:membrane associated rhomboid family serine protease
MYYRPSFFGGFRFFPPVIKWLLISNAGIWLLADVLLSRVAFDDVLVGGSRGIINFMFGLHPIGGNFWPWQLITYMFLHGGFLHLLMNMFVLWMFGMELENMWGAKRFLIFYMLCGIAAGVANLIVAPLLGQTAPTIGASGAVYGVLVAFGMKFPDRPIYVYFLLPVKAKYFIGFFVLMALFHGVTATNDGIAHFAHLGGAAMGCIYMLSQMNVIPVKGWWIRFREEMRTPAQPRQRTYGRTGDHHEAPVHDIATGRRRNENEISQEVIDAILDKISSSGYQSLTEEERRLLNDASKKIH